MLRVGTVPYHVARPLDLGLEGSAGIELTRAVPAELVAGLREGALDVALVSAVELFRRDGYRYLDGWSVAGRGHVSSVQVFLRRPANEVRRVALDPASRAAACLTRVVWPGEPATHPEFVEVSLGDDPRAAEADAWLRIGDRALVETFEDDAHPTLNPSALWREQTGRPFPFAVWVVREQAAERVEAAAGAFQAAAARGRDARESIAAAIVDELGIDADAARAYLMDEIDYAPAAELAPALRAFRDRAAALGLADGALDPAPIALVPGGTAHA